MLALLINKSDAFTKSNSTEKLYVHVNKPTYAAGEDIWFKTYLVEGRFHNPDTLSKVVYVELINSQKNSF